MIEASIIEASMRTMHRLHRNQLLAAFAEAALRPWQLSWETKALNHCNIQAEHMIAASIIEASMRIMHRLHRNQILAAFAEAALRPWQLS